MEASSFLFIYFYWNIIALQCCVSLCYKMKWISICMCVCVCMYTYIYIYIYMYPLPPEPPFPSPPPPPPHHLTPLGHHRTPGWAPCAIQQLPTSYLLYTWQCIYINTTLPVCPTPLPPLNVCDNMSIVYIASLLLPCKWNCWKSYLLHIIPVII